MRDAGIICGGPLSDAVVCAMHRVGAASCTQHTSVLPCRCACLLRAVDDAIPRGCCRGCAGRLSTSASMIVDQQEMSVRCAPAAPPHRCRSGRR
jgi:hypothetical protein